ncbi:MAG: SDR family NAD(P)-dependent oxidoreductase, partial [Victivallaceae bacterium]|nr:SDR family NAD(P)-dependent oxidoreductase [Victivallaceae bacterium]
MNNAQKIVAITGVSGGIGQALARRFRRGGWQVVAICRTAPPGDVCDRFIMADLTDPASLEAAVATLKRDYPRLDCLVNNAGIGFYARWDELSEPDLRHEFELDFFAPVRLTCALMPELL